MHTSQCHLLPLCPFIWMPGVPSCSPLPIDFIPFHAALSLQARSFAFFFPLSIWEMPSFHHNSARASLSRYAPDRMLSFVIFLKHICLFLSVSHHVVWFVSMSLFTYCSDIELITLAQWRLAKSFNTCQDGNRQPPQQLPQGENQTNKSSTFTSVHPHDYMWGNTSSRSVPVFPPPPELSLLGIIQKYHGKEEIYINTYAQVSSLSSPGDISDILLVGPTFHSGNPPCFVHTGV